MAAEQATPEERRLVPLMVMHSINDCTVSILNGSNLRDSWIAHYGALPQPAEEADCMADGVSCTRTRFADAGNRTVVETVIYTGEAGQGTHYWPGDNPGTFANPDGPSATEHLWAFFQDKRLEDALPPPLAIAEVVVEEADVTITGTAAASAGVASVAVALEGDAPQTARQADARGRRHLDGRLRGGAARSLLFPGGDRGPRRRAGGDAPGSPLRRRRPGPGDR